MNRRGSIFISFLKLIIFLVFLAVILKVSINYAEIALREYFNKTEVEVPKLNNVSLSEAVKLAKNLKLNIEIIRKQYDNNVKKDHIISQTPMPGGFVKSGRTIELIVSKGANETKCPAINGKSVSEIPFVIQSAGFKIGQKSYMYSENVKKDSIICQYPEANSLAPIGSKINCLVSLGKSEHTIIVPKLIGYRIEAARIAIEKLDLRLGNVGYENNNNYDDFTVLKQDPVSSSIAGAGGKINLIVNRKEFDNNSPDDTSMEIVKFVVPPGTGPREVKIWLQDETGTREIYRNTHYPTEEIDVTVSGIGKMKILIYLDSSFYSEQELN